MTRTCLWVSAGGVGAMKVTRRALRKNGARGGSAYRTAHRGQYLSEPGASMRRPRPFAIVVLVAAGMTLAASAQRPPTPRAVPWNARNAAAYLDGRMAWWLKWPTAARDHGTSCVSCH